MRGHTTTFILLIFLLTVSMPGVILAEGHCTEKLYTIPNHGILKLKVPDSWRDEVQQPPNDLPPTITFTPPREALSKILITVIGHKQEKRDFNSPNNIKKLVKRTEKELLSQTVETELSLQELKGKSSFGYFFTLTDKTPQSGEYKYMSQGGFGIGNLLLIFTILTNEKDSDVSKNALKMIAGAEQQ